MKSRHANQGLWLEKLILEAAAKYEHRGIMRLRKVDPPTIMIHGQWLRTPSPFLDFVGSWTERQGRAIFIEAKTTKEPALPVLGEVGITKDQYAALQAWHDAGAVSCVLWALGVRVAMIPAEHIRTHVETAEKNKTPRRLVFGEEGYVFGLPEIYNFVTAIRTHWEEEAQ